MSSATPPIAPAPPSAPRLPWHTRTIEQVAADLSTDVGSGLSAAEAAERLARFGHNELQAAESTSALALLGAQFKNVLIVILLIAVLLSAVLGHALEAAAIGAIVLFAVLLGFYQEYRAEKAILALRQLAAPLAHLVRDGAECEVAARDVVPGDVMILRAGNRVPADGRVLESVNLQAEEAALTGESLPVEKLSDALDGNDRPVGDRRNMVYAGTAVTYGRGRALVVATGAQTEFGQIAQLLQSVQQERTPLQGNLDRVGHKLARAAIAVVLLVVAAGVLRGQPWLEMLIFGIALAVAVVPEALPAVVTVSLALGVQRMVKRNALVRRLPAVETLGCTSVICSDKTGTLTKDEMTVRAIWAGGRTFEVSGSGYRPEGAFSENGAETPLSAAGLALLEAGVLASDAELVAEGEGGWGVRGDPTEGALVVAAAKAGLERERLSAAWPRVAEIPFTSETKRMTTLHRGERGVIAFSKGAPEMLLPACDRRLADGGEEPLTPQKMEDVLAEAHRLAGRGLRVLAIASKQTDDVRDAERGLLLLGLVGMMDPPRPEVKPAIGVCDTAGIRPVMITGDHPLTARVIAEELGILRGGRVVTGQELAAFSEADLAREAPRIDVYARVSPADKLRVVTALQGQGECVAMTGDGVNDAPALKKAEIGIAMGITGTDVSKEAAAMTLTDDNFATIVAAVEEGRRVFDNIKKYLMYLLSSNIGEMLLMAGAVLAGLPLPLTAVQILYVNLATDGLPALALAVDPPDDDLMRRPPRDPRQGIFTRPVVTLMIIGGVWSACVNLALFAWALGSGRDISEAVTMTFVSLVLIQFFKAYNYRSDTQSAFHRPFANRWLNAAIGWELVLLGLIVYVPFLKAPFETFALPAIDWLIVIAVSLTVSPVLESSKWLIRHGWFGAHK